MAARLNRKHQESVREKIRASQIVNTLENHVFGKRDMQPSQVTAALGLLKKCVPDLSNVEHIGKGGGPIVTAALDTSRLTDEQLRALASIPVQSE